MAKKTSGKSNTRKVNKKTKQFKPSTSFNRWALLIVMIIVGLLGIKLLWSSFATSNHEKYYGVSSPLRPTFKDVSYKVIARTYKTAPYQFYRDHTATQTERDAMEETLFGIALPQVYKYLRSMGCSTHQIVSGRINPTTTRLGNEYENKTIITGADWSIPGNGRHYSFERYALQNARDNCALKSTLAAECATNSLMTASLNTNYSLADLLDIRIENGLCVDGANFQVPTALTAAQEFCPDGSDPESCKTYCPQKPNAGVADPDKKFYNTCNQTAENRRKARGLLAPVSGDTDNPLTALTAEQKGMVHATHEAHEKVSDWRCGVGPQPEAGIVQKTHLALEGSAVNERQHHFLRMKDFVGDVDPLWSKDEVCKIARFQDVAHKRWMNAVLALNWVEARAADADHQMAHIMMNMKDPELQFRFGCGAKTQNGVYSRLANCPKNLTQASVLANPPVGLSVVNEVSTPPTNNKVVAPKAGTSSSTDSKTDSTTVVKESEAAVNEPSKDNTTCNASNYQCYTDHSVNPCKAYKSSTAKTNPIISSYGVPCTSTSDTKPRSGPI